MSSNLEKLNKYLKFRDQSVFKIGDLMWQIVAFGDGFVVAGEWNVPDFNRPVVIIPEKSPKSTVRGWNTSNGLAELTSALPGKVPTLDYIPYSLMVPTSAIHLILPVTEPGAIENWKRWVDEAMVRMFED